MIMKKEIWLIIGFLMFIIGFVALVLSIIGAQLSFLTWLDSPSRLFGLIMKLIMILSGVVIVVLARTNWKAENEME